MDINIQPFKEPRGFIKILQWLFAICAFATTVDYSGKYGFGVQCASKPNVNAVQATAVAEYPFNMDHNTFTIKGLPADCSDIQPVPMIGNAQSEAVFFVFTGVISFLYATVMICVYLFADKIYLNNNRAPLLDFFITVMIAVFWIAGASAWAHGVSTVAKSMDAKDWLGPHCPQGLICTRWFYDSTSKLVISVLFGFINFVLWCGNIWFLYKETAAILNGVMGAPPSNMQSQGSTP